MLPFAIPSQGLQLIPRRRGQNPQLCRSVDLEQFPQRHALDAMKSLAVMIAKKLLGLSRGEALNHTSRVLRVTLYVKPTMLGGLAYFWAHWSWFAAN